MCSNNFILGNGATSNDWSGIDLAAASWSHIHNNRIFANSAGAVSDVGVRVASLSNHNVIANNGFRNQATCLKVEGGLNLVDANYSERSEEHTSELQSLMRISYAVFCLKKKTKKTLLHNITTHNN